MKNAILILSVFPFLFSSCNKEEAQSENENLKDPVAVRFESRISRVVGTSWEDKDEVGITASDGNGVTYTNVRYLSDENGNFTVSADVQPICFTNKNSMSFTAYYPYSENDGFIFGNTATSQDKCNFLWTKQDNISYSESPVVKFVFNHSMSEVVFKISSSEGLPLADYENPTILGFKHQGLFDISTGEAKIDENAVEEEWMINMDQDENMLKYLAVLFPQTVENMSIRIGDKTYPVEITPSTINLVGGKTYNINMDVKPERISAIVSITGSDINEFESGEDFDASVTVSEN